jgi:protein-S-isoprenylcysteine O-methyltransferase Ste14
MARQGIYARIRHPRYVGSLLAILGACFLAGTQLMGTVARMWMVLASMATSMEQRDLRARRRVRRLLPRQVPGFVPMSTTPGEG